MHSSFNTLFKCFVCSSPCHLYYLYLSLSLSLSLYLSLSLTFSSSSFPLLSFFLPLLPLSLFIPPSSPSLSFSFSSYLQASMDLPDDKKQVVLNSSEEKKRLMVRDHRRQTNHTLPPKFYIAKFAHVLEADNPKVMVSTLYAQVTCFLLFYRKLESDLKTQSHISVD